MSLEGFLALCRMALFVWLFFWASKRHVKPLQILAVLMTAGAAITFTEPHTEAVARTAISAAIVFTLVRAVLEGTKRFEGMTKGFLDEDHS